MLIPFELIAQCTSVLPSVLLQVLRLARLSCCLPRRLLELDRRLFHGQRPRQRPGLQFERHSGGGPGWHHLCQPQGPYDLCVDEARAIWQEEGDDSLQLRTNR